MIDEDNLSTAAMFGGVAFLAVMLILFFVFTKPRRDACHAKGGVMVKIEGRAECVKDEFKKL